MRNSGNCIDEYAHSFFGEDSLSNGLYCLYFVICHESRRTAYFSKYILNTFFCINLSCLRIKGVHSVYFIFCISFMGWVKLPYGTVVILPIQPARINLNITQVQYQIHKVCRFFVIHYK